MTRKKSRPTHRENAAAVPTNEGGFYKMFWNSMDTSSGTNGPNSPSQGDVPVTSPPVIILEDSPEGSPCGQDENSFENIAVPLPIKEETRDVPSENQDRDLSVETISENISESLGINGDCSPHQKCPPGNPLTSPSKNSSPLQTKTSLNPSVCPIPSSTCVDSNSSTSPIEPSSEICVSLDRAQETPRSAKEDGDLCMTQVEDTQVRDQVTTGELVEIFPQNNNANLANSIDDSEKISPEVDGTSSYSQPVPSASPSCAEYTPHPSPIPDKMSAETSIHIPEIPVESEFSISGNPCSESIPAGLSDCTELTCNTNGNQEVSKETAMDVASEPSSPVFNQVNTDETSHDPPVNDIFDPEFSTVTNDENIDEDEEQPLDDRGRTLSLLRSLLNAPEEDLEELRETFSEFPAFANQNNTFSYANCQNEEEMVDIDAAQESSSHCDVAVPNMEIDHNSTLPESSACASVDENVTQDVSLPKQTDGMIVEDEEEEEEEFPTFGNFLPKKIKLDTIGILRSVKVLKESVRSLYKEYLKDDVILRTVSTTEEPPVEEDKNVPEEVEELPSFPPIGVFPICCVKMERLPDPFVETSTVTMSDDTFKTWKRQIVRQLNEEKFRKLKVWRRGRTLLWRECELAGMDRATYDEQVAYVKKHKINESSSSENDSSDGGDEESSSESDSSEESYSDLENEDYSDAEQLLSPTSSPTKLPNNGNESMTSPHVLETMTGVHLPEEEYVVERNSTANQTSETKTPSALKITIRKTSTSKTDDDREKPADEEESFPLPRQPVHKPRKIATKRTFRRPSETIPKPSVPSKTAVSDAKKSKNTPVEKEDLYDQSLLGRRSYEVENFNLLEKWDIPFEEPTLFRSPRAASRLAQLKTKEAFASQRHAPPKAAAATPITTTATTSSTSTVTTCTVSKAVKDVVEMLCSKTVQAILFPESDSPVSEKSTKTDVVNTNEVIDSPSLTHCSEVTGKPSLPCEETSSLFDESSEFSQSETNSTLDASSDFGGSTASLASEDFIPPKNKSPQKPRRRRPRFGPAWGKKKKPKSKVVSEQPLRDENSKGDDHLAKDISISPIHSSEKPEVPKHVQESEKPVRDVRASPAHSTQVPVVSEGPGQSPYESEDDSAHRMKLNRKDEPTAHVSKEKDEPCNVLRKDEPPLKKPESNAKEQDVVSPRLTRSKQPTVELDPELLENFGTRKRKPRTDVHVDDHGEERKKSKEEVTKKTPQKSKALNEGSKTPKELSLPVVINEDSNTQVPEVSEGPGEVGWDNEKQDQENKVETTKPPVRMLRSRVRGPHPIGTTSTVKDSINENKKVEEPVDVEKDKLTNKKPEVSFELESPASPPPETVEQENLISSRVTRSKKRSGPAYIAVKSTVANNLPSVCDIVDSIAGQRLPLSKLFGAAAPSTSVAEPVKAFRVQAPVTDNTVPTSPRGELNQQPEVPSKSLSSESIQPPASFDKTSLESTTVGKNTSDLESTSIETELKSVTSVDIAGQTSQQSHNLTGTSFADVPTEKTDLATGVAGDASETPKSPGNLAVEQPITAKVEKGRLKVLDTLNGILAVTSPTKVPPLTDASSLLPPPLSSIPQTTPTTILHSTSTTTPTPTTTGVPNFLSNTPDINNILPGTFLSSFLNSTLDSNLTSYSNDMNESTSLADDPDGDLVIDEGEVPDVNFWENLTNADLDKNDNSADFSDDDNNTDLADKIEKIIKDQIHQDPVPVPSLKSRETDKGGILNDGNDKAQEEISPPKNDIGTSVLNRRDSIDERTGLPTTFIRRLRDPRIRCRLISQLEEEASKSSQSPIDNHVASSVIGDPRAAKISDPRQNDGSNVSAAGYQTDGFSSQVPTVSQMITTPLGTQLVSVSSAAPCHTTPISCNTIDFATSLVTSEPAGQPLNIVPEASAQPVEILEKPEEPPDPSKVDFLVPPSDDEEEESIKRRPKKAKKEVDVELMYKSPLEDLQSEARTGYGQRGPYRYADNFPRRKIGEERRSRRDERRYGDDPRAVRDHSRERRFEDHGRSRSRDRRFERGRSQSRDRRFEERGRDRSRSRDRRAYFDRPRDRSTDRRAYDPYPGREDVEGVPHHVDMPYQSPCPWPVSPGFPHPMVMPSPHWQPNYYPEPVPSHPPIFVPEPPKIDYMETRLINLELLPKTTNLEISPIRKVYTYFDKDSSQVLSIPPPTYDPNERPHTIKMLDPVSEEMVDFIQTPRPTGGLTKEIFKSVPPDLTIDDVVKFHFISPSYVMVHDNEDDPLSSSDEEEDGLEAKKSMLLNPSSKDNNKLGHKRKVSKLGQEHHEKPGREPVDERQKREAEHKVKERESIAEDHLQKNALEIAMTANPLQNILQSLPLLQKFSSQGQQSPIPPAPPAPEWNDLDLRMSRELVEEARSSPKDAFTRPRSRSVSPRRRSSPRRKRRSRSRSRSRSDMSISPSRSRSRSPSYRRSHRRRRSRSRSSERSSRSSRARRSRSPKRSRSRSSERSSRSSRTRRSRSPKRRSTSVSPSRKHRR